MRSVTDNEGLDMRRPTQRRGSRVRKFAVLGGLLAAGVSLGCADSSELPHPRTLPARFELATVHPFDTRAVDLDGDGHDELVRRFDPGTQGDQNLRRGASLARGPRMSVFVERDDGSTVGQINFNGDLLPLHFQDVDADGVREILVPVVRNDSLFVSVAGADGNKLYAFYLVSGEARAEPDGDLPWDPSILDFHVTDLEGDGDYELVSVLATAYARHPRGVWVNSLPDGRPLGHYAVGAALFQSILADFDDDGDPEIVLGTGATHNNAAAGGFDDGRAYVIALELTPDVRVSWSREYGSTSQGVQIYYGDADADGARDLLVTAAAFAGQPGAETTFELIEPGPWRTLRTIRQREALFSPIALDADRDARWEVIVGRVPDEAWVFDHEFRLVRRERLPFQYLRLLKFDDLDGDGVEEIFVDLGPDRGFALLDGKLRVRARHRDGRIAGVRRRGTGAPPELLVEYDDRTESLVLQANPFFWFFRWGPGAAWALGTGGAVFAGLGYRRRRYDRRLRRSLQDRELTHAPDGLLLLDRDGRPRWINETARGRLGLSRGRVSSVDDLGASNTVLRTYLTDRFELDEGRRPDPMCPLKLPTGAAQVSLLPMTTGTARDPHWLLRISSADNVPSGDREQAWALMAQRVAHSLKNPLTSILLTLQRLQMEYRERAPAVAPGLDRYATRITGRIEELRKLTSGFLKFIDMEESDFEELDLNALVEDFAEELRGALPPDIRLEVRLGSLPQLRADGDQLRFVLDNLVTNAINAMPDGGTTTLATAVLSGVRVPGFDQPIDVAELEVRDTGVGVPEDIRDRLFEPGFSTDSEGSGIGLAIVSKVAADHGGFVTVESEEGVGSAFTVTLPVRPHATLSPEPE